MKKFALILLISICLTNCGKAADTPTVVAPTSTATNNYVLYPTVNMYTFLKLDTRNGKIYQVQYAMDENEFECVLNDTALVTDGKPGQFALYPTSNNWTFILLDTVNGNTYHIQWSQDASNRAVIPIPKLY